MIQKSFFILSLILPALVLSTPSFNISSFKTWISPPTAAIGDYFYYLGWGNDALDVIHGESNPTLTEIFQFEVFNDSMYLLLVSDYEIESVNVLSPNASYIVQSYNYSLQNINIMNLYIQYGLFISLQSNKMNVINLANFGFSSYTFPPIPYDVVSSYFDGFGLYFTFETSTVHYLPIDVGYYNPFEALLTPYPNISSILGFNSSTVKLLIYENGNSCVPFILDLVGNFHFGQVGNFSYFNRINETHFFTIENNGSDFAIYTVGPLLTWIKKVNLKNPLDDEIRGVQFFESTAILNYSKIGGVYFDISNQKILQFQWKTPPLQLANGSLVYIYKEGVVLNNSNSFSLKKLNHLKIYRNPIEPNWLFLLHNINESSCQIYSIRSKNSSFQATNFTNCSNIELDIDIADISLASDGSISSFSLYDYKNQILVHSANSVTTIPLANGINNVVYSSANLQTGYLAYVNDSGLVIDEINLSNASIVYSTLLEITPDNLIKVSETSLLSASIGKDNRSTIFSLINLPQHTITSSFTSNILPPSHVLLLGLQTMNSTQYFEGFACDTGYGTVGYVNNQGAFTNISLKSTKTFKSIHPYDGESFYVVVEDFSSNQAYNFYDSYLKYQVISY